MPTVAVEGGELYWEEHGQGDPLLAIGGLGMDTLSWSFQLPAWTRTHRVVLVDNRDSGRSYRARAPYRVPDMARDALAVVEAAGLERFHLVGMSLGGAIAQELALEIPDRIRTLTLAVSWAGSGEWGRIHAQLWKTIVRSMSREEHVDFLLMRTQTEPFFENPTRLALARQWMLQHPRPQSPEAFVRQLEAIGGHDTRDRVGSLRMPVHVIGAERDVLVPVWKSRELAALIPGAKLTVLEGVAHAANLGDPQAFDAAVLGFVEEAVRAGA